MKSLYDRVIPVFPITVPCSNDEEDVKEKWQQSIAQAQAASELLQNADHSFDGWSPYSRMNSPQFFLGSK